MTRNIFNLLSLFVFKLLLLSPIGRAQTLPLNNTNQIILVSNIEEIIPFKEMKEGSVSMIIEYPNRFRPFIDQVNRYLPTATFSFTDVQQGLAKSDTLIFVIENTVVLPSQLQIIAEALNAEKKVLLCNFSGSSMQKKFEYITIPSYTELLVSSKSKQDQEFAGMAIFGGIGITKTEVSLGTEKTRLQFARDNKNIDFDIGEMTNQIDLIAAEAIHEKATPGMVVMAIKGGQVVFEKAYGTHTYMTNSPTKITDIFDLASVSKVTGTTSAVMNLYDKGLINLDSTIGYYLPELVGTGKEKLKVRTVMLHEAGFIPFIPFYRDLSAHGLQRVPSDTHRVKVADSAYLRNNYYKEVMWPRMMSSTLNNQGEYVYSDISMYVMKELVEHIAGEGMDQYLDDMLYQPIGMRNTGYNPRCKHDKSVLVPTQDDTTFRKVLLHGYVHDEGAAMAGGIAGHAGLFSTAQDLAIYGQMLLNRGKYGGVQYFNPETVDLFTSNQSTVSRRGLGFDRADPDPNKQYPSILAGKTAYGHTGYTGTCIWIDPQNNLIYIFLSNRVHPEVSTKLLDLNIRSRIQDIIYFYLL